MNPDKEKKFLELVTTNQKIIHKVCHMFGRSEEDRQDLFQEITVKLWLGYQSFQGEAAFTTWMYRVAINTAISLKRKNKKHEFTEALPVNLETAEEPEGISKQEINMLYKAINLLDPVDRALVLLYLEEKSYDEIGEILGVSRSNVGVKLVRVKKKLEKLIRINE